MRFVTVGIGVLLGMAAMVASVKIEPVKGSYEAVWDDSDAKEEVENWTDKMFNLDLDEFRKESLDDMVRTLNKRYGDVVGSELRTISQGMTLAGKTMGMSRRHQRTLEANGCYLFAALVWLLPSSVVVAVAAVLFLCGCPITAVILGLVVAVAWIRKLMVRTDYPYLETARDRTTLIYYGSIVAFLIAAVAVYFGFGGQVAAMVLGITIVVTAIVGGVQASLHSDDRSQVWMTVLIAVLTGIAIVLVARGGEFSVLLAKARHGILFEDVSDTAELFNRKVMQSKDTYAALKKLGVDGTTLEELLEHEHDLRWHGKGIFERKGVESKIPTMGFAEGTQIQSALWIQQLKYGRGATDWKIVVAVLSMMFTFSQGLVMTQKALNKNLTATVRSAAAQRAVINKQESEDTMMENMAKDITWWEITMASTKVDAQLILVIGEILITSYWFDGASGVILNAGVYFVGTLVGIYLWMETVGAAWARAGRNQVYIANITKMVEWMMTHPTILGSEKAEAVIGFCMAPGLAAIVVVGVFTLNYAPALVLGGLWYLHKQRGGERDTVKKQSCLTAIIGYSTGSITLMVMGLFEMYHGFTLNPWFHKE